MAEPTRTRVQSDTGSRLAPGLTRTPTRHGLPRSAFQIALFIALILHAPFVPTNLGAWLRMALVHPDDDDDPDAEAIIPIDLDLLADDPSAEAAAPAPVKETEPAAATESAPKTPKDDGIDTTSQLDAGVADASATERVPTDAGASHDAGRADAAPPVDAGPPPLRDPIQAAGAVGKIASKDPNVQVLIAGNALRKHPLGDAFGRILRMIPEWRPFFEGSPIDPIRDLNHLLISAPRLRGDSSKLVAVMDFNVPEPKIRDAVDIIVQRTQGAWLDDTPVPAAQARVSAGDRIFALVPGRKLLVVLPTSAKDQLDGLKRTRGFHNSKIGIVISMVTPARAFKGVFPLPDTLKWLRLAVTPTGDGGADLALELGDKSPEDAQKHAKAITQDIDQIRKVNLLGLTSIEVIDHTEFVADGATLKARVHVSNRQLKLIIGFVEQRFRDAAAAAASAAASAAPAPTPASTPTAPSTAPLPKEPEAPAPEKDTSGDDPYAD